MWRQRLINAVTMTLVSGLSMLVVIYVGFGEAQRSYYKFQVEKLATQDRIVQTAMSSYLQAGLPLRQYVGFTNRAEAILASDPTIAAMTVFDSTERPVFHAGSVAVPLLGRAEGSARLPDQSLDLRADDTFVQVVLPLRNKFERVGSLAVAMRRDVVAKHLQGRFEKLLALAALLSIAFGWFTAAAGPALASARMPWLQVAYAVTFLAMSAAVVGTLMGVYSEGAQVKTKALADSLGQRIRDVVAFNLNIDEIDGLDRAFGEYRRLNPDISAAALIVNGEILIHTDPSQVGRPWVSEPGTFEYVIDLTRPEPNANEVHVAVVLPSRIVFNQVMRSVKNVAALFVASAFFAGLFLQLARSVQQSQMVSGGAAHIGFVPTADAELSLVKPVFFLAVFLEHLTYSFLPQFMEGVVAQSGLSAGFASAPFLAFYLCFALSLIPAGHYARVVGPRTLIAAGLMLAAVGMLTLVLPLGFTGIMMARAVSGVGQGMLFIGVQCYILATASPGKKTQGAAIIVFGFQGGMISGMAIGSLLVIDMGVEGVFTLAGVIALTMAFYTLVLVPRVPTAAAVGGGVSLRRLWHDIGRALHDREFLGTMILIGIPAKAVMTGIIIFGLPLILARDQFAQEDIGQVIMLYAAGVLLAGSYVSRFVDRTGRTGTVLFAGALVSGAGLILIGLSGWETLATRPGGEVIRTLLLIAGVLVVGTAHGFVNAPVVTHVAESSLARRIGASSATATYRFLERIGHMAGPIVVGQLLLMGGQRATVVGWVGAAIALLGFFFFVRTAPEPVRIAASAAAEELTLAPATQREVEHHGTLRRASSQR